MRILGATLPTTSGWTPSSASRSQSAGPRGAHPGGAARRSKADDPRPTPHAKIRVRPDCPSPHRHLGDSKRREGLNVGAEDRAAHGARWDERCDDATRAQCSEERGRRPSARMRPHRPAARPSATSPRRTMSVAAPVSSINMKRTGSCAPAKRAGVCDGGQRPAGPARRPSRGRSPRAPAVMKTIDGQSHPATQRAGCILPTNEPTRSKARARPNGSRPSAACLAASGRRRTRMGRGGAALRWLATPRDQSCWTDSQLRWLMGV